MTGAASTGAEDNVYTLFFQLSGNFRTCFVFEFFDVSATTHEGVGFCRERADKAFVNQFVKTIDREHGIDIFIDIRVIKTSVCNHQHIG